jgi:hypothetical protein
MPLVKSLSPEPRFNRCLLCLRETNFSQRCGCDATIAVQKRIGGLQLERHVSGMLSAAGLQQCY